MVEDWLLISRKWRERKSARDPDPWRSTWSACQDVHCNKYEAAANAWTDT